MPLIVSKLKGKDMVSFISNMPRQTLCHFALPCPFHLPFPIYCDVAQARRCFASTVQVMKAYLTMDSTVQLELLPRTETWDVSSNHDRHERPVTFAHAPSSLPIVFVRHIQFRPETSNRETTNVSEWRNEQIPQELWFASIEYLPDSYKKKITFGAVSLSEIGGVVW
jgi:hypothetical protein